MRIRTPAWRATQRGRAPEHGGDRRRPLRALGRRPPASKRRPCLRPGDGDLADADAPRDAAPLCLGGDLALCSGWCRQPRGVDADRRRAAAGADPTRDVPPLRRLVRRAFRAGAGPERDRPGRAQRTRLPADDLRRLGARCQRPRARRRRDAVRTRPELAGGAPGGLGYPGDDRHRRRRTPRRPAARGRGRGAGGARSRRPGRPVGRLGRAHHPLGGALVRRSRTPPSPGPDPAPSLPARLSGGRLRAAAAQPARAHARRLRRAPRRPAGEAHREGAAIGRLALGCTPWSSAASGSARTRPWSAPQGRLPASSCV